MFSYWNFENYIFEVVLEFNFLPLQCTRDIALWSDDIGTSRLPLVQESMLSVSQESMLSVKCNHANLINHTCVESALNSDL